MTDIDTSKEGVRVLVNEARAVYAGTKRDGSVLDLIKRLAALLDALAKERDNLQADAEILTRDLRDWQSHAERGLERERVAQLAVSDAMVSRALRALFKLDAGFWTDR